MNIKIFTESHIDMLEKQVNEFIKDKEVYDIKYSSLAIPTSFRNGVPLSYSINDRVMVMYDDSDFKYPLKKN